MHVRSNTINGVNSPKSEIEPPALFNVFREITDEEDYQTINMAKSSYKMKESDKIGTAALSQ